MNKTDSIVKTKWLAAVILILMLTAELGVRIGDTLVRGKPFWDNRRYLPDKHLIWKFNPGYHGPVHSMPEVTVNSSGFIGKEMIGVKPDSLYRIFIIGESVTLGLGSSHYDSTCCPMLERILNKDKTGRRYEMQNASTPGYSTFQGLKFVEHYLPALEADALIIALSWNDCGSDMVPDNYPNKNWKTFDISRKGALALSAMMLKVKNFFERLSMKLGKLPKIPREQYPIRVAPDTYKQNISAMIQTCHKMGVQPIILCEPHSRCFCRKQRRLELHQQYLDILRETAAEYGVIIVDVDSVFSQQSSEELFLNPRENFVYLSAKGHALTAELLAEAVKSL